MLVFFVLLLYFSLYYGSWSNLNAFINSIIRPPCDITKNFSCFGWYSLKFNSKLLTFSSSFLLLFIYIYITSFVRKSLALKFTSFQLSPPSVLKSLTPKFASYAAICIAFNGKPYNWPACFSLNLGSNLIFSFWYHA